MKNRDILGLALGNMAIDRGLPRNKGAFFPVDDSADFAKGVRFVPGEVTMARRRGERVVFVKDCQNPCCWRWDFPNGSVSWHWEQWPARNTVSPVPCVAMSIRVVDSRRGARDD